jgi:hypothetical protein
VKNRTGASGSNSTCRIRWKRRLHHGDMSNKSPRGHE